MEKLCTAGQVTDDNIIWRMRLVCWIPKATDTHSDYVILIAFTARSLRESLSVLQVYCLMLFVPLHIYTLTKQTQLVYLYKTSTIYLDFLYVFLQQAL